MARRRGSLKEYQNEIIQRMDESRRANVADLVLFFGFKSGGKNFLIDGRHVNEMASTSKLTPIPGAKPWVVGAANIKGSVYTVTDFSILTGKEKTVRGKFIILNQDVMPGSAILISGLSGLFEREKLGPLLEDSEVGKLPDWVVGSYGINSEKHYIINVEKLATDARFSKLQSGE